MFRTPGSWQALTGRGKLTVALAAAILAGTALSAAAQVPAGQPPAALPAGIVPPAGQQFRYACADPAPGHASCAVILVSGHGNQPVSPRAGALSSNPDPQPYLPADLRAGYQLPAGAGAGQTIAIVDAYDDPNAESDLAAYRAFSHLPACTSADGCFTKVAQDGSGNYPPPDPQAGWEVEESLDLDMASAICPACKLLLVEGTDSSIENLGLAVDEAARLHASVISNSYGAGEYDGEQADAAHWNHPGIVITASTGDSGFGAQVPAAFDSVVAVGGTTLYRDGSARGWAERAWSGAGSGCSVYITKPAWQHDQDCAMRTVADVSAVADPDTPVWLYDSYGMDSPWLTAGGTSVAAPIIAGIYALAGNASSISPDSYLAAHQDRLFDVTGGANGFCGGGYLCSGQPGYDGPTGLGTPDGTGAF